MEQVFYLISDAARQVSVESHVLRYWEEELNIPIKRNELGHRYYTEEDVERFRKIKMLKEQGLQLKAIRMILKNGKLERLNASDKEKAGTGKLSDSVDQLLQAGEAEGERGGIVPEAVREEKKPPTSSQDESAGQARGKTELPLTEKKTEVKKPVAIPKKTKTVQQKAQAAKTAASSGELTGKVPAGELTKGAEKNLSGESEREKEKASAEKQAEKEEKALDGECAEGKKAPGQQVVTTEVKEAAKPVKTEKKKPVRGKTGGKKTGGSRPGMRKAAEIKAGEPAAVEKKEVAVKEAGTEEGQAGAEELTTEESGAIGATESKIEEKADKGEAGNRQEVEVLGKREVEAMREEGRQEKTLRLQLLLRNMIADAVKDNNRELCEDIKETMLKELDYQFRVQEEKADEREQERLKREDEHYKKIDELLRNRSGRKEKRKKHSII